MKGSQEIITNSFGKMGLKTITLIGVVLSICCVMILYDGLEKDRGFSFLAMAFLVVLLGLIFSKVGIKLDLNKKRYKSYFSLFGVSLGFWKSTEPYKDLILLRSKESHGFGMGFLESNQQAQTVNYELYLASKSHFDLLMLKRIQSRDLGEKEAVEYANLMDIDWVTYNPGLRNPRKVLSS